jgi:hypothetical protein
VTGCTDGRLDRSQPNPRANSRFSPISSNTEMGQ